MEKIFILFGEADKQLAEHLSNGLSIKEAAALMKMKMRTVEKRLETMRGKCGAKSTTHLVANLLRQQIIE